MLRRGARSQLFTVAHGSDADEAVRVSPVVWTLALSGIGVADARLFTTEHTRSLAASMLMADVIAGRSWCWEHADDYSR